MTEEEAFEGFPLHNRMHEALLAFTPGPSVSPKGAKQQTIMNLILRKWICRAGYDERGAPQYETTPEGVRALSINTIARARKKKQTFGKTMANTGKYEDLSNRLAFLEGQIGN